MKITLPLEKMSIADKLEAMEMIWADLQNNTDSLPSPGWHADVLQARENRVQEGKSSFSSWNDAKEKIRKSLS
jgi:hypothetical protein